MQPGLSHFVSLGMVVVAANGDMVNATADLEIRRKHQSGDLNHSQLPMIDQYQSQRNPSKKYPNECTMNCDPYGKWQD